MGFTFSWMADIAGTLLWNTVDWPSVSFQKFTPGQHWWYGGEHTCLPKIFLSLASQEWLFGWLTRQHEQGGHTARSFNPWHLRAHWGSKGENLAKVWAGEGFVNAPKVSAASMFPPSLAVTQLRDISLPPCLWLRSCDWDLAVEWGWQWLCASSRSVPCSSPIHNPPTSLSILHQPGRPPTEDGSISGRKKLDPPANICKWAT